MARHVAFLRAVNVSPRWVKMERLRELLTDNGFGDVVTHIQSGNVRFDTTMRSRAKIIAALETALEGEFGFPVPVVLRSPQQLNQIVTAATGFDDPFAGVERRYVTLCAQRPSAEAARTVDAWSVEGERLKVVGDEIHWWLGKPAHEAKISNARLERLVGVATTRDLKVMRALADKWGAPA
jgi:uncharacterized protein (DUF1697 family)